MTELGVELTLDSGLNERSDKKTRAKTRVFYEAFNLYSLMIRRLAAFSFV
jgi:hypothetical protein